MKRIFTALLLLSILSLAAGELKFEFSTNKKDAIYKVNEKIVFTAALKEDGAVPANKKIRYRLYHANKVVKRGNVSAKNGLKIETSIDRPAWVRIEVWAIGADGKFVKQKAKSGAMAAVHGGIGAMVEPEKLLPPLPEPADFDAFWDGVKKELAAVPVKELEKVEISNKNAMVYDVKVACAGDKPVSGYLCVPKNAKPKSCPAYVSFHGAGVRSAHAPVSMAARGFIALDINAHGIENGKPKAFYEDLRKNYYYTTQDEFRKTRYALWNKHDRDKYYFKGMYTRVIRALEYIKSLPEWDGKHLIVVGGSQGGAQVLAACGLDKDITFARAGVPAQCDHSGCLANRHSGWPGLYKASEYKTNPEYAKCAAYFDGAYFAKRIKCPIYFNTGFMDSVCPPSSVFAAYNSVPAGVKKAMQTSPTGGHSTPHTDGQKALNDYIKSILKK